MADPRGRGFKRGNGKWHKPRPAPRGMIHPSDFGWSLAGEDSNQRIVYTQGCYELRFILEKDSWAANMIGETQATLYRFYSLEEVTQEIFQAIPFDGMAVDYPRA